MKIIVLNTIYHRGPYQAIKKSGSQWSFQRWRDGYRGRKATMSGEENKERNKARWCYVLTTFVFGTQQQWTPRISWRDDANVDEGEIIRTMMVSTWGAGRRRGHEWRTKRRITKEKLLYGSCKREKWWQLSVVGIVGMMWLLVLLFLLLLRMNSVQWISVETENER